MDETVFLFGAGASYGATHTLPHSPPLTPSLYKALVDSCPNEWGIPLFARNAEWFRDNFEEAFSDLVLGNRKDDAAPRTMWPPLSILEVQVPMALYFSQFIPDSSGLDCYSRLLGGLKSRGQLSRYLLSSINYDCLLEQAIERNGGNIDYSCRNADSVRVAKLHGSCNLITQRLSQRDRAMLSSQGTRLEIPVHFLPPSNAKTLLAEKLRGPEHVHFPVMSQISPFKEYFLSPVYIQRIQNNWREAVSNAKRVIVIGVKYNAADHHITEPIGQTRATLHYVGDPTSFASWKSTTDTCRHLGETFETALNMIIDLFD